MVKKIQILLYAALLILLVSCNDARTPKPVGYFRIELPEAKYVSTLDSQYLPITNRLPYAFEVNSMVCIMPHAEGEEHWIDLFYPRYDVSVHCSYKPVLNNLREVSDDAQRFVYNHAGKANAIPEQGYENEENQVYGVLYELVGNTASPCQLYMTDSLHHFFRAAVYFNCIPNQDSLAPIKDYIVDDMRHLVETLRWRN